MPSKNENSAYDIFDDIPDGYYEVDLRGRYTFVNKAIRDYFGCEADAIIGKRFKFHTTPRCAKKTTEFFYNTYCTGRPGRMADYEFVHPSGRISYIELSISLIRDDKDQAVGFRGIARECTERVRNESERDRYRNFVESIEDGCFEVDLDGTMTFINEAMCKIHGYAHKELLGMNHRGFASPEEARSIFHTFNQIYKTGITSRIFDYTIIHKDGTPRNLEVSASLIRDGNGKPMGFRGITRDRTDKKIRELELERYRNFVENVQDACFEVDLKGNITFFNEATCRSFGYSADELMGMNNRTYTTPETAKKVFDVYNKIYKTGQPAKMTAYEIIGGDGKIHYLDTTASLITDPRGEPVGFRGISRDVTDQVNKSAESECMTELIHQSQRLETVATLAAGVAHNFNNLFMSIQGNVSLIQLDVEPTHPHHERCKAINALLARGSELTLQLLSYADCGRKGMDILDVCKIIDMVTSAFSQKRPDIQISHTYGSPLHPINGNMKQMQHVFTNLMVNAGHAMPDGGAIIIEAHNVCLDESTMHAGSQMPGNYVMISITDTGAGMAANTLDRIFEPFFTTKKPSVGAGLGLASAYGVIKSHNGFITVESRLGKGTTFKIFLPEASPHYELPETLTDLNGAPVPTKTILLVDDDPSITKVIGKMIKNMGYQLIEAHSGQEAVDLFKSSPDAIDLVIMDIVMPGLAGDQAIQQISDMVPGVKAILMSGFIEVKDIRSDMPDSRQVFLQKPISRKDLTRTIVQLLEN